MSNGRCSSCRKPKNELKARTSKVMPGTPLLLCANCFDKKYEPRGLIVLAGRAMGQEHISVWIKKRLYLGDEITLKELL